MQLYSKNNQLPTRLPDRIRLSDGRVRTSPNTFTAAEIADAGFVAVPPKPIAGQHEAVSWVAGAWVVSSIPAEHVRKTIRAALADYRWGVETGGVDLAGSQIETTREAQAQISSTYSALKDGLVTSVEWKAATGWLNLDLIAFTPIAQAVAAHVQGCFAAERAVSMQIDGLTDTELAGFDVVAAFDAAIAAQAGQGGV